jgi:hypothetical protein
VDEATPDEDTTYVKDDEAVYGYDLYNLPAHSGSGTINSVTVYIRAKRASSYAIKAYTVIKTGGTEYYGSQIALTASYADYSKQYNTNPKTGIAWTWDDIDALQAGIGLNLDENTNHGNCTQVYVEVDYSLVTAKTSSDTGSGAESSILGTETAKSSSDTGSGVDSTPVTSAILADSETGSGLDAPVARLLAAVDTGISAEAGGLLKGLFAAELGQGSDSLTAKIEKPTKGGGMKLWM